MHSIITNGRLLSRQHMAKIYTCIGRDIDIAAYMPAYVLEQLKL